MVEPDPSLFERRIALFAELEVPVHGRLGVVGTHLHHADREIAARQARSLLSRLDPDRGSRSGDAPTVLVAGDFNLEAGDPVFRGYHDAGYLDSMAEGVDRLMVGEKAGCRTVWADSRGLPLHSTGALPFQGTATVVAATAPLRDPDALPGSISDHPLLLAEIEPLEPRSDWPGRWTSSPPTDLGFDVDALEGAIEAIGELAGVECVLVVRHGRLAVERYFRGADPRRLRNVKSVSKSVLSAIVGIAIEQGHLALDDRLAELLPPALFGGDELKQAITVGDLLTMRSGLESTSFGNYGSWTSSRDWVADALARPLLEPPGTRMRYSTGDTHLLSAVLTAATGTSTLSFAEEHLFRPLGIDRVVWQRGTQGIYVGGNNLSMTARDIARFGQLYLDRGRWGERQIVPWQWVDASTRPVAETRWGGGGGYGYLWWIRPEEERGAYTANGFGGQYIYVAPAHELVVVIGSSETSKGREWRWELFDQIVGGIVASVEWGSAGSAPGLSAPANRGVSSP